jgi:anti-anti-sigma factor
VYFAGGNSETPMVIEESAIGQCGLVVALRGSLNAKIADKVKRIIAAAADRGVRQVVVDLQEVPFIDSSGLVALLAGARYLNSCGGSLRLVAPQPQARLLLELTMAEKVLHIYTDRTSALEAINN